MWGMDRMDFVMINKEAGFKCVSLNTRRIMKVIQAIALPQHHTLPIVTIILISVSQQEYTTRMTAKHSYNHCMNIEWIPGHSDIPGSDTDTKIN